ncbi:hypothetical protein CCP2SC5_40020 [Azospirillaceae bacterium]
MRSIHFFFLATITVGAVGGAGYIVKKQYDEEISARPVTPGPFFPDLKTRLNDITTLKITNAGKTVTLARLDDHSAEFPWTVIEKSGYYADLDQVKQAAVGLSELIALEPRTNNPDLYVKIGVNDVDSPVSVATQIVAFDAAGKQLAGLLIGKNADVESLNRSGSFYARRLNHKQRGEPQSWLVEGRLPVEANSIRWLYRPLPKIAYERLMAVSVRQPGGAIFTISRSDPKDHNFTLLAQPDDVKTKSSEISDVSHGLDYLSFDEVSKENLIDFKGAVQANYYSFDGLVVTARSVQKDGKVWANFTSHFDTGQAAKAASQWPSLIPSPKTPDANSPSTPSAPERVESLNPLLPMTEVEKEAKRITQLYNGWAFQFSSHATTYLMRKIEDLIVLDVSEKKPESK